MPVPDTDSVAAAEGATKAYVLDTSVLLADPLAVQRFDHHDVVIPVVALLELQSKQHHPELGWNARQALRQLEELRVEQGGLDRVMTTEGGGTVRIEVNHSHTELPDAFSTGDHDQRVLSVCRSLAERGMDVELVSKDLPLRLKASVVGIAADEYLHELARSPIRSGFEELEVPSDLIDQLYRDGSVEVDDAEGFACHTGVALRHGSQSALTRLHPDNRLHQVRDVAAFEVRGRSAEQKVALELLTDPDVGIVSLGGPAGTGKSLLAIASGIHQTLEDERFRRVLVFRPLHAVGGQELGYLPGTEEEKMDPWAAAVHDALAAFASENVVAEIQARNMLEVLPLTHLRGRTLTDSFVIIDEAQNLERSVLLTALSRIGENAKVVLTHDIAQRDNLRVGRHDGIVAVVEALSGHPLFAHVTLSRSERSPIAELVTRLLDHP